MAKVYGNRGPYYYRGAQGIGGSNELVIGSWLSVSGAKDDVVYISVNDVSNYEMQMGCYIQATGDVSIDYTLQNPAIACDRNSQDTTFWGNTQAVTAQDIVQSSAVLFTAIKITFTAAADVFFYTR